MVIIKDPKRRYYFSGIAFTLVAILFMIVGFSTSHWVDQNGDKRSRIGLWEVCYREYTPLGAKRIFTGCWWLFSESLSPVKEYVLPSWFISVQVMIGLTFLLQGLVAVFLLCLLIHCCPIHVKPLILTLSSIVMFLCGLLIAISLIVFGVMSEDRQWMPRPDQNYLSWSFGICVLSGFFSLFSAMCLLVSSISSSREQNPDSKALRMQRY